MRITRRHLLRAGGASLAWPLLESVGTRTGHAQADVPPRLVIVTTGQGTLLERWRPPTLANDALELSQLLQPLAPHQDKLLVVSGADNLMPRYHHSNGHNAPGHTLLCAHLCESSATTEGGLAAEGAWTEVAHNTLCMGPSIDHYLAEQLGSSSINLAIEQSGVGENQMYYRTTPELSGQPNGARSAAALNADSGRVFDQYLAGAAGDEAPASTTPRERLQSQRQRVLDHAAASYAAVTPHVSVADRARLEAHSERLLELSSQFSSAASPVSSCDPSTLTRPGTANTTVDHWKNQVDVLVNLLACNVSRVVTLHDSEYHGPDFGFLQDPLAPELRSLGALSLPGAAIEDWHAQVHGDSGGRPNNNENLIAGFTFYATQFRYLLDRMTGIVDPNGGTLLDNSLVLWLSEFGNGGTHSTRDLPVVLAGSAGGRVTTGRHLARPGHTNADLFTSLLQVFGLPDERFGFAGDTDLQNGGIPGIT